jgi:NAD-dependent deacetylase
MPASVTIPAALVEHLRRATRVVALTGAGVSAESGVPTFRDAQTGLWARFRPEDLATPEAFHENPQRVWQWYAWRRELVGAALPNPGHFALAQLEKLVPELVVITQNVDGLHRRAGSEKVTELHGNLFRTTCSMDEAVVETWPATDKQPPPCPSCGAPLRPGVVWFGENLPATELRYALERSRACEIFLSIGTSSQVYPAAQLPLEAKASGAVLVEINPAPTPLSAEADFALHGPSGLVLPELVAALSA